MVFTTCRQARTLNFVLEYIEAMEFMLDHVLADGIGLEVSPIELESYFFKLTTGLHRALASLPSFSHWP